MLLLTDFDGTLRDLNDSTVLSSNLAAVQRWRAAGNEACLITGRNFSVLSQILPEWKNYFSFLATDNGGAIFDYQGDLIATYPLSENIIEEILTVIPHDILPVYYYPDHYSTTLRPKSRLIKLRLWFHDLDELWSKHHYFEANIFKLKSLPWPKHSFSPLPGVDLSNYCGFIDLVPPTSGKEIAAQRLSGILSFPHSEIIAVGDDYNDIPILEAFKSYAISSAPPEVICAASGRTITSISALISQEMSPI